MEDQQKSRKTASFQLKCNTIQYRSGFIEIIPGIHEGCVNIETWDIEEGDRLNHVEWLDDPSFSPEDIRRNCELEMNLDEAKKLAEAILKAVAWVEKYQTKS